MPKTTSSHPSMPPAANVSLLVGDILYVRASRFVETLQGEPRDAQIAALAELHGALDLYAEQRMGSVVAQVVASYDCSRCRCANSCLVMGEGPSTCGGFDPITLRSGAGAS